MFFFKLVLLVCSCYHVYGSESSEEIDRLFSNLGSVDSLRGIIRDAYNENKLETITDLITSLQEDTENITLVGTQNIYGTDGELVEIRTVELHWPKVSGKSGVLNAFDDEDDADDDDVTISEVKTLFKLLYDLGLDLNIEVEVFDKGLLVERAYMDTNLTYEYTSGIGLINKTIEVESIDVVENIIAELKKNHSSVSVHKFDKNFQFVSEGSLIVPELVANIYSDDGETNKQLFDEILKGLTTLIIEHGEDNDVIPGKLVEYLKTKYPDNDFYVFSNEPDAFHLSVKESFKVTAQYDLASWERDEDILYTVFGFKKR